MTQFQLISMFFDHVSWENTLVEMVIYTFKKITHFQLTFFDFVCFEVEKNDRNIVTQNHATFL